jgi:WD40 repeat protein
MQALCHVKIACTAWLKLSAYDLHRVHELPLHAPPCFNTFRNSTPDEPSPNPRASQYLLTASLDGTIKIWSPGSSGSEVVKPDPEFRWPEEDASSGGGRGYRQVCCNARKF